MKAVLTIPGHKVAVQDDIPKPNPGPGEILVKVHYVAQNPTDWKTARGSPAGRTVGCDFAGTVADANGSPNWRVGQRVAGWVHGQRDDRGAFAEYLITEVSLVFAVPDSTPLQAAAGVSLAVATAVQAMFQRLRLPGPIKGESNGQAGNSAAGEQSILINGGTSSVGLYAIQLAKLAGLHVIVTGSKQNHDMLRSLGADVVVDYRDSNWPEQVQSQPYGENLQHALDCISEGGTILATARAMSKSKGGHLMCLLPYKRDELPADLAAKIKIKSTVAYTVFERPIDYTVFDNCGGVTTADRKFWEKYLLILPDLLASGKLKPNPVRLLGGLDDIPEGFKLQEEGKVRAEKLVYKVASDAE